MSNTKNLANLAAALDDGTSGQVLQSTGSGGVQFADSSGSGVTTHTNQTAMVDADTSSAYTEGSLHFDLNANVLYVKIGSGAGDGFYAVATVENAAPSINSFSENTGGAGANDLTNATPPNTFTLTAGNNTVITINATEPNLETISYSATVTSGTATDVFSSPSFPVSNQSSNVFTLTPVTSGSGGTVTVRFDASDGTNVTNVSHSFEIAFVIADSHYTSLLMATDGSAGDNSTITYDTGSTTGNSLTVAGDTHAGTFSPYRHGGYSTYFAGSGDFLSTPDDASLDLGSSNFTLEFFVYMTAYDSSGFNTFIMKSGQSTNSFQCDYKNGTTELRFLAYASNSPTTIAATTTLSLNTWYHICITRSGNTITIYKDGTSVTSSTSFTGSMDNTADTINIGQRPYHNDRLLNGYLSDLRLVNGTAITPASGGPTERLTAVTNTSLLTCHLPYISDTPPSGGTAKTITVNGNTSTKPFGPYDYDEYDESINGGSVHYDGTGDYLTLPTAPTLGTSDFEISMWLYPETISGADVIIDWRPSSTNGVYVNFFLDSGVPKLFVDSADRITGSSALPVSAWSYLTLTRVSGSTKLYVNGIQTGSTYSDSNNYLTGSSRPAIGQAGYNPSLNLGFNGYMADLIIKLSGNSSPSIPTAPVSSSGTALHIKGIDAHVIDKSQGNNLKLVGNAAASTTQAKFSNTASVYFDGTGDHIEASGLPDLGAEDWTIEFWARWPDFSANRGILQLGKADGSLAIFSRTSGQIRLLESAVASVFDSATTLSTDTWYHIAYVNDGTADTQTLYINGSADANSGTRSTAFTYTDTTTIIGGRWYTNAFQDSFSGYIQDLRITAGKARYTNNFTVPSAPLKG